MKTSHQEPLLAIFLKASAILTAVCGLFFYVDLLLAPSPGSDMLSIARAGQDATFHCVSGSVLVGSAISLWWMASVISFLSRIAENGERSEPPAVVEKTAPALRATAKPLMRTEDDGVPYKLD